MLGDATRSQVVLLVGYAARLLLALAVTTVLGRALSPEDFGFFTLIGTALFLAHVVFEAGTGAVATREIARRPEKEASLLEGMMGWRRAWGALLGLAVGVWAALEPDAERRLVLVALAVSLPFLAPQALRAVFGVRQEHGAPELVRTLSHALVLVGGVVSLALGAPGSVLGIWLVVQALVNAAAIHWLALRKLGYRVRAGLRGRGLGPFARMAAVHGLFVLLQAAYFYADVVLVLVLRGDEELGAYAAAFRPINPLLTLAPVLMVPLLPIFSRVAGPDPARLVTHVRNLAAVLLGLGALAAAIGFVLAPELVWLLYGGRYSKAPLDAAPAMQALALALGFALTAAVFQTALLAKGREDVLLRIAAMGLVVNVAGNALAIPRWGFTGAAILTALTNLAVGVASVASLRRVAGPGLAGGAYLGALLPGILAGLVLSRAGGSPGERVALGVAVGAAGAVLLLARPASRHARRELALETDPSIRANPVGSAR